MLPSSGKVVFPRKGQEPTRKVHAKGRRVAPRGDGGRAGSRWWEQRLGARLAETVYLATVVVPIC